MSEAWTCVRCNRERDWEESVESGALDWDITAAGILCPDCITADDIIASKRAMFYRGHIRCACLVDLGPIPEKRPAEVNCTSCGSHWTILDATETGLILRAGKIADQP